MKHKVIEIHDLTYGTLLKLFESDILYDTDIIFIKFHWFEQKDIDRALTKHLEYLLKVYTDKLEEDSEALNNRGKVIDFLMGLPGADECEFDDIASHIQETLMMEQMRIYGLRKLVFCGDKRMCNRYFNPNAEIAVEEIT